LYTDIICNNERIADDDASSLGIGTGIIIDPWYDGVVAIVPAAPRRRRMVMVVMMAVV